MQFRNLGNSGLKVSVIGLGTNQFGGKVSLETTRDILSAAIDSGINFIDTADVYQKGSSEEFIGQALEGKRHEVIVATKVFHPTGERPNDRGASRQHILTGVEDSLRRLKTDYIDLYQIHRWDNGTPIDETMRALDDLIRAGKIRYIGASNFDSWQLVLANTRAELNAWTSFVSVQPHYHLLERGIEKELIPACENLNVGILPYFPLAGGFLTGKYTRDEPAPKGSRGETSQYVQRYMTPENFDRIEKLGAFAQASGHTMNELAHAWLISQPQVSSVISGATRIDHVLANAAAGDWVLDQEDVEEINQILQD